MYYEEHRKFQGLLRMPASWSSFPHPTPPNVYPIGNHYSLDVPVQNTYPTLAK